MSVPPWVLVAGGFHRLGGTDRANMALAEFLQEQKIPVHLVGHTIDEDLARKSLATVHRVRRPLRRGPDVVSELTRDHSGTRVVVNGGNCMWGDMSWVHCVHRAWPRVDGGTPTWFRAKNRMMKARSTDREARVLGSARLVIENADRTRRDLMELVGVKPDRIQTIRLGDEAGVRPPCGEDREQARRRFASLGERPIVTFVGAVSHNRNKSFDTFWFFWTPLCGGSFGVGCYLVADGRNRGARGRELRRREPACKLAPLTLSSPKNVTQWTTTIQIRLANPLLRKTDRVCRSRQRGFVTCGRSCRSIS